jgi:hypothetical protein
MTTATTHLGTRYAYAISGAASPTSGHAADLTTATAHGFARSLCGRSVSVDHAGTESTPVAALPAAERDAYGVSASVSCLTCSHRLEALADADRAAVYGATLATHLEPIGGTLAAGLPAWAADALAFTEGRYAVRTLTGPAPADRPRRGMADPMWSPTLEYRGAYRYLVALGVTPAAAAIALERAHLNRGDADAPTPTRFPDTTTGLEVWAVAR